MEERRATSAVKKELGFPATILLFFPKVSISSRLPIRFAPPTISVAQRTSAERRRSYTLGDHGYRRFNNPLSSSVLSPACCQKIGQFVGGDEFQSIRRRAELAGLEV